MSPRPSADTGLRWLRLLTAVAALHGSGVGAAAPPPGAAEYERARHFSGATGQAIDEAQALDHLRRAAGHGYLPAQVDLGFAHLDGKGRAAKDLSQAFVWFRKAADQGSVIAQCMLGDFYRDGLGGAERSDALALQWYRRTAASSDRCAPRSQFQLYKAYELGRGVPKDMARAVAWLKRSADAGNPVAQATLGRAYLKGYGVPRDEATGRDWLKKSREGVAPHDDEDEDAHAPASASARPHRH